MTHLPEAKLVTLSYARYIERFNARDPTAFDEYLAPDVRILNGTLELYGVDAMKRHYARIWESFSETITCHRIVQDDAALAVQMWTHFAAVRDDTSSLLGPVLSGECFDYRGVVFYDLQNGRFSRICVAYNSFTHTDKAGNIRELGIPH